MHWRHTYIEKGKEYTSEKHFCTEELWQCSQGFFADYFASDAPITLQTLGYCVRDNHNYLVNRCVDKYAIHYVLSGKGFFNGKPFEAGDILYCSKNTPYNISSNVDNPCTYVYVTFRGGKSDRYVDMLHINEPYKIYKANNMDKIAEIFYDLIECPHNDVEQDLYMESALLKILAHSKPSETENSVHKNRPHSFRVEKAIMYISEHYSDAELRISTIADALQTNEQYLRQNFKKEVGISIYQYITNHRMEVAATLLMSSHYNINEIAEYVGYNDRRNFIEIFKKKFGVTPSKFKTLPHENQL